ncbi:MAG: phosphoadenosine phosphosulfate reductase, partial [Cyanobacteria bacterium J06628_3]
MTLANNLSIVEDITKLESEYSQKSPQEILAFALKQFDNITISFSGAEDVVLIDMASKIKKD